MTTGNIESVTHVHLLALWQTVQINYWKYYKNKIPSQNNTNWISYVVLYLSDNRFVVIGS